MAEEEKQNMMKIRQAVSEDQQEDVTEQQNFSGMQPSMMETNAPDSAEQLPQIAESQNQNAYQDYNAPGYDPNAYADNYGPYASNSGLSADTVVEIAEQVITERMSKVREALEEIMDFKTAMEAKVADINERLKRIESTIDRLQLSILQKVGEYVTNTEDIKKEIVETQKSFKALLEDKSKQNSKRTN